MFKTIIGPLVPDKIRGMIEEQGLNDFSMAYRSLIKIAGNLAGALVLFGLDLLPGHRRTGKGDRFLQPVCFHQ